jgi:hypothetical protein
MKRFISLLLSLIFAFAAGAAAADDSGPADAVTGPPSGVPPHQPQRLPETGPSGSVSDFDLDC